MADVFLSYSRQDLRRVKPVIAALEAAGLSVWWDRRLVGGSEFSKEIREELDHAAAVVAVWSSRSVNSPWVLDEAGRGRDSGRLVPACLDGMQPPLGFGQIHTIDLSHRHGAQPLEDLVAAVTSKIGRGKTATVRGLRTPIEIPRSAYVGSIALVLVAITAAAYLLVGRGAGSDQFKGGTVAVHRFEALTSDPESKLAARLASDSVERIFATNLIETAAEGSAPEKSLARADFGLRGTVDRNGSDLRITADVIDSKSGRTLWSTEVSRPVAEGRQLGDEFAILVANVLRCSIYSKRHIPEYDSPELFSRILRYCDASQNVGTEPEELPKLAQALIEVAPKSAQAHAYYADELALSNEQINSSADLIPVQAAIKETLALDSKNGAVRWAMAKIANPSVSLAMREKYAREGLRLDPNYIWNRALLGRLMLKVGRVEEGRKQFEQFVGDYPLDYNQRGFYAYLLAEADNLRSSREQFDLIRKMLPGRSEWANTYEWRSELLYGDIDRARLAFNPGEHRPDTNACISFVLDARKRRLTPSATEIDKHCAGVGDFDELSQTVFGHVDDALRNLDKNLAATAPPGQFGPDWVFERGFEKLRQDPRLIGILAKAGIPQYWLQTGNFPDYCKRERLTYDCRQVARQVVASLGK